MKNTIRCCISCILPCGALDVIRIVHSNGRVEEISGTVRAEEVMKAHPKHILKKPTSRPSSEVEPLDSHPRGGPAIMVVPPDAQLQRGKIYFLIPIHDQSTKKKTSASTTKKSSSSISCSSSPSEGPGSSTTARRKRRDSNKSRSHSISVAVGNLGLNTTDDDKYLSDILSEKVLSSHREKRRGRVAVWRPHLESINETLSEAASSDQ
ncbi:hypothetical protein SOVF_187930 [Spinacia oleracea]|uniref:Uncharacterized protein n=1 Tax=Spinacia oleracea TaxID=3562 RepID=A0A9R0JQS6_SPIOL|nr:uncharacterized protein LOC110783644 [Spinacia oleracea]KNA05696.1 hypothetical protein SOVF_187930 [Spinacia oleracea]